MSGPTPPTGYDVSKVVRIGRSGCCVGVGFDRVPTRIPRFLVQLHYADASTLPTWRVIARFDHNATSATGHNVYHEGLHVDVTRRSGSEVTLHPSHSPLPSNAGAVIRGCVTYFEREADTFVDIFEGRQPPGGAPAWSPDGGRSPHEWADTPEFMPRDTISGRMYDRPDTDGDAISSGELTELLAEATATDAEEIEAEAEALTIESPATADRVDE
jgi:hypothetical protein